MICSTAQNGDMIVRVRNGTNGVSTTLINKEKEKPDDRHKKDESYKVSLEESEKIADRIEEMARILFPLSYATFNIIYWIKYLS